MCDAAEGERQVVFAGKVECAAMRRSKKLAVACGVLAVGIAVALLSRGESRRPGSGGAAPARHRPIPPHRQATLDASPVSVPDEPVELPHLLDRLEPVDEDNDLAIAGHRERITAEPLFGESAAPWAGADAWRPSRKAPPLRAEPSAQEIPPRQDEPSEISMSEAAPLMHRVRKGDTLSSLAARYLGSGERFWELFAANRDRLRNPDLLPVGLELRIPQAGPPREAPPRAGPPPTLERPLAPIAGRADR